MKLMIVDDDKRFRQLVAQSLSVHGHSIQTAAGVREAWELLETDAPNEYDLILLDVLLPDQTGWDFLDELRRRGDNTPVIFLTGRHSLEDRVRGLEAGADDYVVKPFVLPELLARIEAVWRRNSVNWELAAGSLRINRLRRRVTKEGRAIDLSPREFDLLVALAERRGSILSRDDLLRIVWGIEDEPGTNLVAVTMGRLRKKVDCVGDRMIETVVGGGYRLADEHS